MLTHFYRPATLLRVTGEDAAAFLQGQFTNDLGQPVGAVVYGLWLDQKGRVLADSHVLNLAPREFLVVSTSSAVSAIRSRLEEYIVADDVMLTDETMQVHGLAVSGSRCGEIIRQALGGAAPPPGRFLQSEGMMIFAGRRMRGENHELIGPENRITDMQRALLARGGREVAANEMERTRILDGMPSIPQDVGPGDLPNEGGLEDVAISFTKGCYLGQEVMARLKSMGQIRRRLHVIRGEGAPPARAPLYQGEKKVGEVRSVAVCGNEFVALAMLSLVNLEPAAGLSLAPDARRAVMIIPHG